MITHAGSPMRRAWFGAGCALIALVASGAAAAVPAQANVATLTWQAGDPTGVLLLARGWPQQLTLTAPCNGESGSVDTGEMRLDVTAASATVSIGPSAAPQTSLTITPQGPPQTCKVEAVFTATSNGGVLQIKSGFDLQQAELERSEFPIVTRIMTSGTETGFGLQITTRPTGSSPSMAQQILRALALLALLAVAGFSFLSWRSDRNPTAPRSARFSAWDPVIAVVSLAAAVFTPALLDDGWMRQISRQYSVTGAFSNLFDNNDAWFPQGYWLQWLFHPLVGSDLPLIAIRLVIVLVVVATWLLVRRAVLPRAGLTGPAPAAGAALIFLIGVPAWLLTLRSEPVIALLAAGVLAAALSFWSRPRFEPLALSMALAAAAVAGHQTGWLAATPLIVLIPSIIRWLRSAPRIALPGVLLAAMSAGAVGLLLLFLDSDIRLWLEGVRDFSAGGRNQGTYHSFGLIREVDRWTNLISDTVHAGSGARLFAVLVAAVVAGLALAAAGAQRRPLLRVAVAMSFAAWAGLLLTSSKWIWHLGALVPATALLGAAGWSWFTQLQARAPHRLGRAIGVGLLALLIGITLAFPRAWGVGDLATLNWSAFAETVGASGNRVLLWLLLASAAALLTYYVDERPWRTTALATLCAGLVLIPVAASWAWIAADAARTPGWTFLKQNLSAIATRDANHRCGAGEQAEIVVDATAAAMTDSGPALPVTAAAQVPGFDPSAPPTSPVAPFQDLPTWGTWPTDAATPTGSATGSFTSPWQLVTPGTNLSVWVRSPRASAMEATVRFADLTGTEFVTAPIGVPIGEYADEGDFWRLTLLVVPESAVLARVQLDDFTTRPDGWAAFTSLANATVQPFATVQPNTVFASPFLALAFPCVPPTPVTDGVLAKIDYVVQPPAWQVRALAGDAVGTQVTCQLGANWCVYRMDYQQAVPAGQTTSG